MAFNKFSIYSTVSQTENLSKKDTEKVLSTLEKLHSFDSAKSVKTYLRENLGIQNDVIKLAIANNVYITTKTGKKYFNVTIKHDKTVKSFNYNKNA